MPGKLIEREMRTENLPHIWCPGCSHGSVMRALCQAIENAGLDRKNTIIVSGIGCSSRAVGYLNFDTAINTKGFVKGVKDITKKFVGSAAEMKAAFLLLIKRS